MTAHVNRPIVYIAGPYGSEPVENTHRAIKVAERLDQTGLITAYVPHMNLLWGLIHPHEPEFWYAYDVAFLVRFDALLRMTGVSPGADDEVELSNERNIPVFYDENELLTWAELFVTRP